MIDSVLEKAGIDYNYGEYKGKTFFIFNSVSDVDKIEEICPMELLKKECDFDWGYADEYTFCSRCGEVVKITPDYHTGLECFVGNGEVFCFNCLEIDDVEKVCLNTKKFLSFGIQTAKNLLIENNYREIATVDTSVAEEEAIWIIHSKAMKEYKNVILSINSSNVFYHNISVWAKI